jgi:cytochrome c-type biogenesis protein CcmH/NrfG
MKKESLLLLVAGVLLGAVLGYIATREYYEGKLAKAPPSAPPAQAGPVGQPASPAFDPDQHKAMLDQIRADIAANPADPEKRIMLANIYFDGGKFDQAIPWYEEALKLQPQNTDVLVDLGICNRNLGKMPEALAYFEKALGVDPKKRQALYNRVVVLLFDLKDKAGAERAMRDLEALYPDDEMTKRLAQEVRK